MSFLAELLIALALVVSGIFGFVGSYGLIKLKGSLQRLHAPTKATTLGVGGVLIASMIFFAAKTGTLSVHELLITLFLFLTAPITANFIAKTYMARNMRRSELPENEAGSGWSVYDDPPGRGDETGVR
ncbi:Na+/H+ antiporter subunit G [Jannaschia seohaensis]|uniref:Multicomponent K+:H+ antiporter subunit G n=1 Tax=Jannaschia seohaensis TaxID=475081 RepID=A0A2Y9C3N2_9RHOB|nr:Na+/H+ antiporter subunit G [Jannaschia seohaensis]PWJ10199.1 multicomponent K+:H+ antiporter subunit G [Jannaschia seohaensis]SSA51772.1 multicomponent K+:H+ antiporter subunit G [Jannaschia seohaensis]